MLERDRPGGLWLDPKDQAKPVPTGRRARTPCTRQEAPSMIGIADARSERWE